MVMETILIFAIFFNFFLSIFVLIKDQKSSNNYLFSLLSLFGGIWTFVNYSTGIYNTQIWLQSTYAFGSIVISIGLIWILIITKKNVTRNKLILIVLTTLFFFISSFYPGFITVGWGLGLYALFFIIESILIVYYLFDAQKYIESKTEKTQLRYILIGSILTLIVTALGSFIFPLFSVFYFGGFDNVSFLIFLFCISIAILRHHLFNIKVILIELVTFGLWVCMLVRVIFAQNIHDMLVEGTFLVIVVVLGILLIQNILRGIKQSEEITKLTKKLEESYGYFMPK